MDLDSIVTELRVWASLHAPIHRVWVFGSRAREDARAESDLDVALELFVSPNESPTDAWFANIDIWRSELSIRFPFRVQLELLEGSSTPTIHSGTSRDGVLAYEAAV